MYITTLFKDLLLFLFGGHQAFCKFFVVLQT